MLSQDDIILLLDKLGRKVVVDATSDFPYEVVTRGSSGYHEDPKISKLQAKLSIMLEAAGQRERK